MITSIPFNTRGCDFYCEQLMSRSVPHKWKADLNWEEDKLDKRKKKGLAEVAVVSKKEVAGEEIDDRR